MAEQGNKYEPEAYPEDQAGAAIALRNRLDKLEEDREVVDKKIKAERGEFKKVTGIKLGVFDSARRDAGIEDENKRQTHLQNYVTCFNAMGGDEQFELTGILDHAAETSQDEAA